MNMTKNELLELQKLLNHSEDEAILFAMNKLQIKSKKKRIRKKVRKQIISQLSQLEHSTEPTKNNGEKSHVEVEVDVTGLPVTFLLGLGKQYFPELDVVKSYYTKTKEEYYKNKELLCETINQAIKDETPSIQSEIIKQVEERQ